MISMISQSYLSLPIHPQMPETEETMSSSNLYPTYLLFGFFPPCFCFCYHLSDKAFSAPLEWRRLFISLNISTGCITSVADGCITIHYSYQTLTHQLNKDYTWMLRKWNWWCIKSKDWQTFSKQFLKIKKIFPTCYQGTAKPRYSNCHNI